MRLLPSACLCVALVACDFNKDESEEWDDWSDDTAGSHSHGPGSSGGTGSGSGEGNGAGPCAVEGTALGYPTADATTDFYYRAAVEFVFDGIDPDATVSVTDGTGSSVAGSTRWVESNLVFQPTVPLAASSSYSATMTHCAGSSSVSFRTSTLGTPLNNGVDLVGKTFVLELDGARFVKPAGIGSLLLGLLEQDILFGVTNVTDTEIEMIGAISKDNSSDQDRCEPSIDFPEPADFNSAPFFSIGPENTTLSASGYDISINQLNVAGDFTSDGSAIGGAILSGEIDAREIVGALVGGGLLEEEDPDAVCELIFTFGVSCEPCSSDGQDFCLSIYVDQITAPADDQTLVAQDACDPSACSEGCR